MNPPEATRTQDPGRGPLITAVFLVLIACALGVGAWQLAHSQANDRKDLRTRYGQRAPIASSLVNSLFQSIFSGLGQTAAQRFAGDPSRAALDAYAKQGKNLYVAIVDDSGRLVAGSAGTPSSVGDGLAAFERTALKAGQGVSDILPGSAVVAAVRFPGSDGRPRLILSASAAKAYDVFLSGSLKPLAPSTRSAAYVLDGNGAVLGAVSGAGKVAPKPSARLVSDARAKGSGTYDLDGSKQYFATDGVPTTAWKIVLSVSTDALYGPITGTSRWLPWVILVVAGLALLTTALLVRRVVLAGGRLAEANGRLEDSQIALRQRAQEVERSNEELKRSNADLEQFAYVASHDLSAPLRAIAGFSQLLGVRYKGTLDPKADEFIGHMQGGVERMQRIIDDLLLYSRVDRSALRPERVDLEAVLAEVLLVLAPEIEERGGEVTHDPLPEAWGEAGQLAQVLQNLIANGLKFARPGQAPQVHVSAEEVDGRVRIAVRDHGIGIDAEHRERIFKMFQRLHTSDEYPGTGIGLAVSKKVVERHGGDITVHEASGGGAVFAFDVASVAAGDRVGLAGAGA